MAEKTNQRVKYRNGKIFTADENHSFVDTMIVENGRIVWTGKEENAEDCGYKETDRTVDLNGECVLPGFVDAHMHPVMLADFSRKISALPPKVHSIEELIQEIRRVRERQKAGQWIEGWGYDEGKLAEKRSVNRYDLDRGCSDSPVSMIRTCGHIRCVNSMALRLAGIDRNTPDPEGGEIERDENGEPTGVLKENARNLILPFMPEEKEEDKIENLVALGNLLTSQGIVAVCDMGNLDDSDNEPLYQEAARRGFAQKVGIYYMWDYFMGNQTFDIPKEKMDRSRQIFAAGLKLIGDGSVSGRTAWMSRPYVGSCEEYGISVCTDEQMETAFAFCKEHKCQLSMHAMGGKAISRVVERAYREDNWMEDDTPYVRVEHITDPSDDSIRKAAEKGIAFVTQPIFMYAEIESYLKNLGEEWMKTCYPVQKMLDAGVKLCFSTDAPATSWAVPSDPFPCIKGAVTRKAYDGTDCGQAEAIDIRTAVCLYTREAAKAAGFGVLGMIKKGYEADFIVLDKDIFEIPPEEIDKVKVKATYIGGNCVYRR